MTDNAAIIARLDKIDERLTSIETKLFVGNGTAPMSIRLDRLEQANQSRTRHFFLLWTTVLGIFATIIGERIVTHLDAKTQAGATATAKP